MTDRAVPAFAVALLLGVGLALSAPYFPERFSDFRAFYCAGRAVLAHADPYREHPLAECERGVRAPFLSPLRGDVTVPAPFPGYALALFALLGTLPFAFAAALWALAAVGATIWATFALARLSATPLIATAIAIAFPAFTVALPLGQITPVVLAAIVGTAVLLSAGRPRSAAFVALGALLEPHVGIALVLGLAVGVPRARLPLAIGVAALAALGWAVSGPANEWEYVHAVLPAHALANLADATQFSTAHFAYAIGLSAPIALALGGVWYGAALALGTFVAVRARAQLGSAALALVPPAFAVFGGTHTHLAQLALAVPAFLLLCAATRAGRRNAAVLATGVAALPWLGIAPFPLLFPGAAVLAVAFARSMGARRASVPFGIGSLCALGLMFVAIVHWHSERGAIGARVAGNPLVDVAWQTFVLARNTPPESWSLFAKGPTVIAFCALLAVLVNAARGVRLDPSRC
jgi:hypothetical protein